MVAVRTGFPSPMQPMGSFPPMALPAGQTPVPAPVPPMPLAGFPPPPVKSPMAQQVSNAPRRRRFGDSLEGMLGRNIFATQQQRPMPTPMMPRPMAMGGAVQYFANGGNANQQAAASMLSAGIGNVGGKAITSEAQDIQDRFSGLANRRSRRRRKRRERRAREEAARLAAEQAALESERLLQGDVGDFNRASNVLIEPPSGGGAAALPTGGPGTFPPAAPPPPSTDITPEVFIPPAPQNYESTAAQMQRSEFGMPPVSPQNYESTAAQMQRSEFGMPIDPISLSQNIAPKADEIQDALAFAPQNYESTASQMIMNQPGIGLGLGDPDVSPGFSTSSFGQVDLGRPGDRGFTPSGTQIAPEAATVTPTENFESTRAMLESNVFDPDKLDPRGDQIVSPTGTGIGQKITPPKAGTGGSDRDDKSDPRLKLIPKGKDGKPVVDLDVLRNTGLLEIYLENLANPDERLNRTPQVPGAAQTQLLTDAFNMASKDPNFLEQVIGKVVKNLTFGTFDPNERNKAQAQAILDAYLETGTFAYDSEKDALDLSDTPEGRANFEKLQEMSAGDGQEIGTIGVYDAEGNIVGNNNTYVNTKDGVVVENIFDKLSSGDDDDDTTTTTTDDDKNYTTDKDGNIVCNDEGYIYNPETEMCEPPKETDDDTTPGSGISTGTSGESFEDVLKRVVVAAPDVAPISANVRPMQEGGMAGLNRAADNFLKALAG